MFLYLLTKRFRILNNTYFSCMCDYTYLIHCFCFCMQEDISEFRYEFACPNGELECIANKLHACATYFLAKRKKHTRLVEIISCLMGHPNHKRALSKVSILLPSTPVDLRKCLLSAKTKVTLCRDKHRVQYVPSITRSSYPMSALNAMYEDFLLFNIRRYNSADTRQPWLRPCQYCRFVT